MTTCLGPHLVPLTQPPKTVHKPSSHALCCACSASKRRNLLDTLILTLPAPLATPKHGAQRLTTRLAAWRQWQRQPTTSQCSKRPNHAQAWKTTEPQPGQLMQVAQTDSPDTRNAHATPQSTPSGGDCVGGLTVRPPTKKYCPTRHAPYSPLPPTHVHPVCTPSHSQASATQLLKTQASPRTNTPGG